MNEITTVNASNLPALPVERVLQAVIAAASDPAVDVAKMRELLGLQKELMAMQAEQQFNEAFHRLQLEMPRIKKDGTVEYKNKQTGKMEKSFNFATWEAIDTVIRPILQREGFSLSFDSAQRQGEGGGIVVTGKLSHIGGACRTASIPVPLDTSGGKNNIQGYGSAMSYGRRYTATALLNIVTEGEDDSGVRGGKRFISAEQCRQIEALITNTKSDRVAFLRHFELDDVPDMEEAAFVAALNMLSAKKAKMKPPSDFPGDR
jgi:ERF superfamily